MSLILCPSCQQSLRVNPAHVGRVVTCPNCKNPLTIPAPQAAAASAPPAPISDFEQIAVTSNVTRPRHQPMPVKFPLVFHVAAWFVILTCIFIMSGWVNVRIHDTILRPTY